MKPKVISALRAREVLDSRGNPTLEVEAVSGEVRAAASVPSGASTGSHEAKELRDGGKRYRGLGVLKACRNVEGKIARAVVGLNPAAQTALDDRLLELDGTKDKSRLGANATLAVSWAAARLAAQLKGQELYEHLMELVGRTKPTFPVPLFNIINGGKHADSGLDIQEYFVIPLKGDFPKRLEAGSLVYHQLKEQLENQGFSVGLGDEGGFAPHLKSNEEAFVQLARAIKAAGYSLGKDFTLGIDAASSEFYRSEDKTYHLKASKKGYTQTSAARFYRSWVQRFHLSLIEDGCAEDDFLGWKLLTQELGGQVTLVGDDLFVTDVGRIQSGINQRIANAVLIKPNQIGTVSETLKAIRLAQASGYKVVISHRSGETGDSAIADLAVAVGADFLKAGAPARGERLAKYNRLLAIYGNLRR